MKRKLNFFEYAKKRTLVLLVISILLFSMAISTTIAYLVTKTDTQDTSFDPPLVKVQLDAYDDVVNKGNIPVYVRSIAVINWLSTDDEHTISSEVPVLNEDYYIDFATEGWFEAADGFFYYTKPLNPGETVNIIVSGAQLSEKPGYKLQLQLLTNTIQAEPSDIVNRAWPYVEANENGELVPVETPNGGNR